MGCCSPSIFASDFFPAYSLRSLDRISYAVVGRSVGQRVGFHGWLARRLLTLNSPSPFSGVKFAPRPGLGS